ncbi:hypothetical protein I4U23_011238 [Adineta vaga]|nr:hypothetical protein I4U23_011238 [Adineta vaga]
MNPCIKVGIIFIILAIAVIIITIPTVLSIRKKKNQNRSKDETTISNNSQNTSVGYTTNVPYSNSSIILSTTMNNSTNTRSIINMTVTTMQPMMSHQPNELNTTISSQKSSYHLYNLNKNSNSFSSMSPCNTFLTYYEALEFNVSTTAHYNFVFKSDQYMNFYFYHDSFHPAFEYTNLMVRSNNGGFQPEVLSIQLLLYTMTKYILLMTVSDHQTDYIASINVTGPDIIDFISKNISIGDYSNQRAYEQSALTEQSPVICDIRSCSNSLSYIYYETLQFSVSVTEYYHISVISTAFYSVHLYNGRVRPFFLEKNIGVMKRFHVDIVQIDYFIFIILLAFYVWPQLLYIRSFENI